MMCNLHVVADSPHEWTRPAALARATTSRKAILGGRVLLSGNELESLKKDPQVASKATERYPDCLQDYPKPPQHENALCP